MRLPKDPLPAHIDVEVDYTDEISEAHVTGTLRVSLTTLHASVSDLPDMLRNYSNADTKELIEDDVTDAVRDRKTKYVLVLDD